MTEELSVMPTPPSASRECRGSSAALLWKGKRFQFGDKLIDGRITDADRGGRPASIVSVTGSISRKNTYDEFRG
jgi:hypothetical protein